MALPVITFCLGGGTIAAGKFLIDEHNSKFIYYYAKAFTDVDGDAAFISSSNALFGCLVGAGMACASGVFGCLGAFTRVRFLYYFFLLLTIAAGLAMVIGGGMFFSCLPHLSSYTGKDADMYFVGNPNDGTHKLNKVQQGLLDYNIAIFNTCCIAKQWASQGAVRVCTGDSDVDCPPITNDLVKNFIDIKLLCTCSSSKATFDAYAAAVQKYDVCSIMQYVYVDMSSRERKIPTVPVSLAGAVFQTYPSAKLTKVPLVGFQDDLSQFEKLFPGEADAPESGFGCGFGFVKGISWFTYEWYVQNLTPVATASVGLGASIIVFLVIGLLIGYLQKQEESNTQKPKHILEDRPAEFVSYQLTPQAQFAEPIQVNRSSGATEKSYMQNTVVGGATQLSNGSADSNRTEIVAKLKAFYGKHEPDKSMADVEDVATWASANGIDQLNKKLMGKYGEDLDSYTPQASVKGIGKRAMGNDVDI